MTMMIVRHFKVWTIALLCLGMLIFFLLNQQSGFYRGEVGALYSDGHYISQVAKNLATGNGYSYWDGFSYSYWDYEISTGPTIIFPMAAAILLGFDIRDIFSYIPLAINISLFATLLLVWSRRLDGLQFFVISFSAALFFACFQRWLWYLPLGDVASVLLFFLSLSFISSNSKSAWPLVTSGIAFSLAMLSKLMLVLALPVLMVYLITASWRNFRVWTISFSVPVFIFVFLLFYLKNIDQSPGEFFGAFYSLVERSILWAFPEFYVPELAAVFGWLAKLSWNWGAYNNVWWDDVNQYHLVALLVTSLFVSLGIYKNTSKINVRMLCLIFSLLLIFFIWAFLISLKGGRYSFMFVGLMSLSTLLLAGFLGRFWLLTGAFLMCVANGYFLLHRGIVLEKMNDDPVSAAYSAAEGVMKFMSNKGIKEIVITDEVNRPYLNAALYMEEPSSLVSIFSLLDKQTYFPEKNDCLSQPIFPLLVTSSTTGQLASPSFRCLSAKVVLNFHWLQGFEWKYVLDAGDKNKNIACSHLEMELGSYRLYRCSRQEIEELISSQVSGIFGWQQKLIFSL